MKSLKTLFPFVLMFLGIGLLAGVFIPQSPDPEKPVLVENAK